jgi:hypothetical protein
MHSNCTVCGVKLNNKNRVEYRPNSCRDCELERKRLYSLKRKDDNAKRSTASAKVKSTKSSKKVTAKKPASKKAIDKLSPAKKAQLAAKDKKAKLLAAKKIAEAKKLREKLLKDREKERLRREKERERLLKDREKEKIQREKDRDRLLKEREKERLKRDKDRERLEKQKEKERLDKLKDKERARQEKELEKEKAKQDKLLDKEFKRQEKEAEKERKKQEKEELKRKKIEEKESKAREKAEKEKAERAKKKLLDMNVIVDVPDYIVNLASAKVKKRRLEKVSKSAKKAQIIEVPAEAILNLDDKSLDKPFNPEADDPGEILRAPSDTPWEGSNFKIVGGVYVNHTESDTVESRGPSEEEVKAIIERIRMEHKTKKDGAETEE